MKGLLFSIALLVSANTFAQFNEPFSQRVFDTCDYKDIEFTTNDTLADYIVVIEETTHYVVGWAKNIPYGGFLTFYAPGEYLAFGAIVEDNGEVIFTTDALEFVVDDSTKNLSRFHLQAN